MTWRDHIKAAIEKGDGKWSMEAIEERLRSGSARLVVIGNSSVVVWVEEFPLKSALVVAFAGGRMDDIDEGLDVLKAYAKQLECQQIDIYGRKGWARALVNHGFRQTSVVMSLEV